MRDLSVPLEDARPAYLAQAQQFVETAGALADLDLLDPSRCRGWSRLDLVTHVRMGLEEMAAGAGVRTDSAPTQDAASYWESHPDDRDTDAAAHVLWLRRVASAYSSPSQAVAHLTEVAGRAGDVVEHLTEGSVRFQGKVMTVGDFVATWAVELAVHHLDLDAAAAEPVAGRLARRTVEAVAGADLPAELSDRDAVLAGLGRIAVPAGVTLAGAFPISL